MNLFRFYGDMLHLLAFILIVAKICKYKSCAGVSAKTQILFALVFTTRYLDIFTQFVSVYNVIMKILFIAFTYVTLVLLFYKYRHTRDRINDTFPIEFLIAPCFILALVLNHEFTVLEVLWTFSIYLEAVAILPQLLMLSKIVEPELIVLIYVFILGLYRALYIVNWVHRYITEDFFDGIAYVSGFVQTLIYLAFFCFYAKFQKVEHSRDKTELSIQQPIYLIL